MNKRCFKLVKTLNDWDTLYSPDYDETYHSLSGAFKEPLNKFCAPCKINRLAEEGLVRILDIGFGLGYNIAAAIHTAKSSNPNCQIYILALEKDLLPLPLLDSIDIPDEFINVYDLVKESAKYGRYSKNGISIKILTGDGRTRIKDVDGPFDAVFLDPFSPRKNPELWTVEFFRAIKRLMTNKAVLATYSASTPVRTGLLEAGLKIGWGPGDSMKKGGTIATTDDDINVLSPLEIEKLNSSPEAIPYHGPDTNMTKEEIISYREELMKT